MADANNNKEYEDSSSHSSDENSVASIPPSPSPSLDPNSDIEHPHKIYFHENFN